MIYYKMPHNFTPKFEVVTCYIEFNGKFLMLLRAEHKPQGNTWSTPAGKIEKGESPHDAIIREVKEETTLDLSYSELKFVSSVYVSHDGYQFIYHMYKTVFTIKPQVVITNNEHVSFAWKTPEEAVLIPNLMPDEASCIELVYGKN